MPYCSQCGSQNADDAKFCSQCGTPLAQPSGNAQGDNTATITFGAPPKSDTDERASLNPSDAAAVDALPAGSALVTDGSARPASAFRLPNSSLAGPAGLEQGVRDGFLREADASDGAAWIAARRARQHAPVDAPPIAGGAPAPRMPSMFRAYVVLKAYTLPAGLYGANSATFFVPKGVPRPTGKLGHSTLYDFNTLSCAGVACWH